MWPSGNRPNLRVVGCGYKPRQAHYLKKGERKHCEEKNIYWNQKLKICDIYQPARGLCGGLHPRSQTERGRLCLCNGNIIGIMKAQKPNHSKNNHLIERGVAV